MDLTLEAYRNIIKYVENREDIATLCRVSKRFQSVGERALYHTLYLRDPDITTNLCMTLARQPRVAVLVDALTVYPPDEEHGDGGADAESDSVERDAEEPPRLPDTHWDSIAVALEKTTQLKYLNIHANGPQDKTVAWILDKCTFRLRQFHCDLDWDQHLVAFLNKQIDLDDLYIADFLEHGSDSGAGTDGTDAASASALGLDSKALPKLTRLECAFCEAAIAIVPGRPVKHLKTCFSRSKVEEKWAEMRLLLSRIDLSTGPLRSLDIADSSYSEAFSMAMLENVIRTCTNIGGLRYLGTLVLPIAGQEVRLRFEGVILILMGVLCSGCNSMDCLCVCRDSSALKWKFQSGIPLSLRPLLFEHWRTNCDCTARM